MRKLMYFTLGHNIHYLNLAELCISSLINQNYDGDFLFITNFRDEILQKVIVPNRMFFLDLSKSNLLSSSANKLKLYKFEKIHDYDKIIFCDLDILWLKSPNVIFDMVESDEFYMSNENALMSDDWWGKNLITEEEKKFIIENEIKGVNAGIFAFNSKMVNHLKFIDEFLLKNQNLVNSCLEQPFINIYLFRNSLYNTKINEVVSHNGYNSEFFNGAVLHFAGGPGNYILKYQKMIDFFNKNFLTN